MGAIAVLCCCGWPAAAHAIVFGASVDGDFNYLERGRWTWKQTHQSLLALRATGATVGRTGSLWAQTEPRRPQHGHAVYDWSKTDTIVRGLAEAHLRWEPTLDYTPKWAQQHIRPARNTHGLVSPLPPADNSTFAAYAHAFARRYGVSGSFWSSHQQLAYEPVTTYEIWNEPDCIWTWGPDINLEDYAQLYAAGRRAIRSFDPHATVVTGGLAFTQSSLGRLLHALSGMPVDAMAVHPYGRNAAATVAVTRWVEHEMALAGRGRTPLYVNEFGWTSVPKRWQSVTRRALPDDVRLSIVGLARIRQVKAIIPFEWADDWWGLSTGGLQAGIRQVLRRR